jgi:predicted O-methyltransferase YrrM
MPVPPVRHAEPSVLLSLDDEVWGPSRRLLDLAARLAAMTPDIAHPILSGRAGGGPHWFNRFPGEHYHLLTAICRLLDPEVVWEFGTDTGMSTVAILEGLKPGASVYTVDVDGWETKQGSWLVEDDFGTGRVTQIVCDMKSEDIFSRHAGSLAKAGLIFVDGPKDGFTEAVFLDLLDKVAFVRNPVVLFDDIRLMNMLDIWRSIQRPKMDLTSFGHWSGTGLVDWSAASVPAPAQMEAHPSLFSSVRVLDTLKHTSQTIPPVFHAHAAFEGQSFRQLETRLGNSSLPPDLKLRFCTLDDGYFWIEPWQDGVLFTADGTPVPETLNFRGNAPFPDIATLARDAVKLDFDVFIGVDAAWRNYYHWLCLAIPKMMLARHVEVPPYRIVIPEYRDREERGWKIAYSERVWDQSLSMSGLSEGIVCLPPGLYTSRRVHSIHVDDAQPAWLSCFDDFYAVIESIRGKPRNNPASPKRLLVARRDTERVSTDEASLIATAATSRGFVPVYLEDLDFVEQAELFFNAEAVIAPHGSGLSNLIFGNSTLRVLEINRCVYPETHLRPWFYLIARGRNQYYMFLNATAGEIEQDRLHHAIDVLCSRRPSGSDSEVWWRTGQQPSA